MKVIYSGRKTNRTTTLIHLCAEAEERGEVSYIVCHSHQAAYDVAKKAEELGLRIGFPLTFHEFLLRRYSGQTVRNLFIDNADMLLKSLAPTANIEAIVLEREY